MVRWSAWAGLGAAAGLILALVPVVRGSISLEEPLQKLQVREKPAQSVVPELKELDLTRLDLRPRRVLAPLPDGKVAELTLDPVVQRAAQAQMDRYEVPEGGLVMMDVKSGRLLAYASHVSAGKPFDVNVRAEPPAASVFKIVTGAALIEKAGLNAGTEQCYHGGKSRILADELRDDARRDKWCATLGSAMGRSLNVVFGRLAQKHLTPEDLTEMGGALGFGAPLPFVVPNDAPTIEIPDEPLEFARSAAGFWHSTLSPLAAASLAQTVANGGVALEPRIVAAVRDGDKVLWKDDRGPVVIRRAIKPTTAAEITRMMRTTTENGSAYASFHDKSGVAFLPGIPIAGKTGTLTRYETNRYYTWFVGFAPADAPEVTIAALVVNTPSWKIKAPELARNVLRAHFAALGRPGVTAP
jgi:penicillin-binding protein A